MTKNEPKVRDVGARHKAGEPVDPNAPGVVMPDADPELARLADLLTKAATGEVDRAGVQAEVLQALARRAGSGASAPVSRPLGEIAPEARRRRRARAEGREACLPVPWPDLARVLDENATDGRALRPGVHVLVGGTGSGKTQLALELALAATRGGHPVWYVGLELDGGSVTARLDALAWAHPKDGRETVSVPWSVLDWPRTSRGRGKMDEVERAVAAEIDALPIRLVFGAARSGRGGFTVADLEAVLAEATEAGTVARPALVVMDFLQLLAGEEGNYDDREIRTRIARASYAASNHTRDGRVAVLLVSATSREGYKDLVIDEEKGMPYEQSLVGAGKESGEIEYAATSVLVLARTKLDPTEDGARVRLLAVAKNRHGGTGWVAFWWKDGTAFRSAPGVLERLRKGVPAAPDGGKPVQKGTGRNAAKQGGPDGPNP